MTEEEAFLAAIHAAPDDDVPRLVYSDWLEECGSPADVARAEFIRTQVQLAALAEDAPRRPALEDREHELLTEHEARWLGDCPRYVPRWRFERGFLAEIETDTSTLAECGAALFARHPITRLILESEDAYVPGPVEEVGAAPWLGRLASLRLSGWYMHVGAAESVLVSPHLTGLTVLDASGAEDDGYFPALLIRCPSRDRLRKVGIPGVPGDPRRMVETLEVTAVEDLNAAGRLADNALAAILNARFAGRLVGLRVSHNCSDHRGWMAFTSPALTGSLRRLEADNRLTGSELGSLLALPGLGSLDSLKLSNRVGVSIQGLAEGMAGAPFWQNAVAFETHDVPFPEPSFAVLCQAGGPAGLKKLDLMGTGIGRGLRHLATAPFADTLTHLGLGRCGLNDDDLALFASSGSGIRLRSLDLRAQGVHGEGGLTDAGVLRLLATPTLARLRSLNLTGAQLTARGMDALLNGGPWRLAELHLWGCGLTPEAVAVLASSPALARLQSLNLGGNKGLEGNALLPLAESPYLSRLCDLTGPQVSTRTRQALQARLGIRARSR